VSFVVIERAMRPHDLVTAASCATWRGMYNTNCRNWYFSRMAPENERLSDYGYSLFKGIQPNFSSAFF
jgi:hypothetical protein